MSNCKQNVQILTLVSRSWTIKDTTTAFDVSERMVKQARKLKTEQGILAFPANRQGRKLSAEVVQKVHDFFEDDEIQQTLSREERLCACENFRNKDVQAI